MKFSLISLFLMAIFADYQLPSFYDFRVNTIDGKEFNFEQLKGKKVLIVNTASKCGYTPQYKQLEELYQKYKEEKFIIIGFPSNDFGAQEPGTNEEILEFCQKNYGVSFPLMAKISVKGDDIHPVYQWLTQKSKNGVLDAEVKWNFQKFMIDEKGNLVDVASTREDPLGEKIINWLKK